MVAATRRQRARAASNTGEQVLLVLRKNGWMTSPDDARSEAVCRAAALADDKLPASTAVRRLTERFARNVCAFLVPLIAAGPAYADAVRLELKEFTNHPEFSTFDRLCDTWHGTSWRAWFVQQLANAPSGPPAWLQA